MSMKKKPYAGANPFRGFVDVMSEMNRAQSSWMQRGRSTSAQSSRSAADPYVPPADIFAMGDDLVVRCEVAGVRKEDVNISVANGVLTIWGSRDNDLDDDQIVYYARERLYGQFRRTMLLPDGIDMDDISASTRNGLLEIRVHGGAASKPRTVPIVDEDDD